MHVDINPDQYIYHFAMMNQQEALSMILPILHEKENSLTRDERNQKFRDQIEKSLNSIGYNVIWV